MMVSDSLKRTLVNIERMRILRDLALIDGPKETIYDRFTQVASDIIDAPVSLVSMVAANYQFFKSQVGLPDPWASDRRTPLSHSFCQHVVHRNEPLVIKDAREHELVKDNKAIPDLNVIGYLGIPLTFRDHKPLGSFCVIDSEPREWEQVEIDIMEELADLLTLEFDIRAEARIDPSQQDELTKMHDSLNKFIDDLDLSQSKADVLENIRVLRRQYELH